MAYWGWTRHAGAPQLLWAVGLPVVAAAIWGIFRVHGDPGRAPVPIPGPIRLLLETVYFTTAVVLLAAAGQGWAALLLGVLVLVHYAVSYERVVWLLWRG
jgi:hypothetical protein